MTKFNIKYEYLTDNEIQILHQCPYQLTLSIDKLTKSAVEKRHNPPRPQNSWIIFRRDYEAYLRCNQNVKSKVKETAKTCSLKWRKLSSQVKHFFKILEKIAYENHKLTYPNYKYKPKNAKTSSHKKFIFREQKKYVSISPVELTFNSPQEPIKIDGPSSLTSNSPQELIQIDRLPSLTLAFSTTSYNNLDYANNFTTVTYDQQNFSNDFTATIYNQQDFATAIYNQDYTNDLAQNSINVFNQLYDNNNQFSTDGCIININNHNDNNGSINFN
ncbi:12510_t:CDS:1 [Ambispora gerdemannii]|uniref:12510_t:CDS:1 n=1 Tax=Ambispora gerdemannii TaxID=144530 RepID=A0A9N8WEU6_9GLOM|nr:12510_t:CDS:1 [Ambispora gerdemannii]